MSKLIAALLCALVIYPGALSGMQCFHDFQPLVKESFSYEETNAQLDNPYCGWYQILGYKLSDTAPSALDATLKSHLDTAKNNQLLLIQINLNNYSSRAITDGGLNQLTHILDTYRSSSHQLILRFLYDWDGKALETEPKDFAIIKKHITQLAPIVNRYADLIYIMQGIFLGDFAEMHHSNYMDNEHMTELAGLLDSLIDERIYLSVRTPAHHRTIRGTYIIPDSDDVLNGSTKLRLGLYNDGMLGSANDVGTYGDDDYTYYNDYTSKGSRQLELEYQNKLCLMVPNGGEAVLDNPYNDLNNAIRDLKTMRVSYLNQYHHLEVLNKWRATTYYGDSPFNGCSGYDYIGNHLGYRYSFSSSELSITNNKRFASMKVSIKNSGFAPCYRSFSCYASAVYTDTAGTAHTETIDISKLLNNRSITPDKLYEFNAIIPVTEPAGPIDFYLRFYDPATGVNIDFANSLANTELGYHLGQLSTELDHHLGQLIIETD